MRKTPSDADTIIDLLEKCQRNLRGIELRTVDKEGRISSVSFSHADMKDVAKLVKSIEESLSGLDERLSIHHEVIKVRKPKPPKQLSAVQEYMRKYK